MNRVEIKEVFKVKIVLIDLKEELEIFYKLDIYNKDKDIKEDIEEI